MALPWSLIPGSLVAIVNDGTPSLTEKKHLIPPSPRRPVSILASSTTASSTGSNDATKHILKQLCSPASILFDPRYTAAPKPSARPPFRTFPPSPRGERRPPTRLPSTISVHTLDSEALTATMDKRNPSSFQQLEKLGEGTYATVCAWTPPPVAPRASANMRRSSKGVTARPASSLLSRRSTSIRKKALPPQLSARSL